MANNGSVGSKRPSAHPNANQPHKRRAEGDDDLIDEQFDMEPPDDDFDEPTASLEEVEDNLGEAGKNWQRPPPPQLDPATDRLVFQQLEVDFCSGAPNKQYYPSDLQEAPILRMFGVTELGKNQFTYIHSSTAFH